MHLNNTYIAHHGIKGQKWGAQNGPPYPLPASKHSSEEKKHLSKYVNVDGTLNEKGKEYRDKYVEKKTAKNNKYYEKYKAKYQKKADKANEIGDKDAYNMYMDKKNSAEESRISVNKHIKDMPIDEIIEDVKRTKEEAVKKGIKIAAIAGVGAVGLAGVTSAVQAALTGESTISALASTFASTSYESVRGTAMALMNSKLGKVVGNAADMTIRAYADVRGLITHVYLDEVFTNLKNAGTLDAVKEFVTSGASSATSNGISKVVSDTSSAISKSGAMDDLFKNINQSIDKAKRAANSVVNTTGNNVSKVVTSTGASIGGVVNNAGSASTSISSAVRKSSNAVTGDITKIIRPIALGSSMLKLFSL